MITSRARERLVSQWEAAGALSVLLVATVAVRLADPHRPGSFPACPFREVTGLSCPGCGSLRALADLAHGHVLAAAGHNAVFVAFLPVAVLVGFRRALGFTPRVLPSWAPWAALATLAGWAVMRNLLHI
ncbi:MAG TPA: DUF2752 domain-containing protein [Frankiaceae bacterium]|nr:DUF2752 domain-containing protein [Frankiaceae bacterium]